MRLWTLWATPCVAHKSTALLFGFAELISSVTDRAEQDRAVADLPSVINFEQTDRLSDQRFADVDRASVPFDLAVLAHAPDEVIRAIAGLAQHTIEAPR